MLKVAFREQTMGRKEVSELFFMFKSGVTNVGD
jgi:hypothetical protein